MARLNRNLEQQALGRVVAAEFCEVAGGEGAWFKYMADGLGGEIIASRADMPALEAVQWPQRFTSPGASEMTARLIVGAREVAQVIDRKSTRLNSSHVAISYAVFCLKKKKITRRSE